MSSIDHRICSRSGFALVASPRSALRIARESYGPLNPVPRTSGESPHAWSRYDTPGRTIYACADRITAYMELLAPYRTEVNAERRALQPIADALGRDLDELWRVVVTEWDEAGTMKANWLPRAFREGRKLYTLTFPSGWWIDITATETIAALEHLLPHAWPTAEGPLVEPMTLAHLTGDDRVLTTAIATVLRGEVTLDDGTLPLGIRFLSKHGHPAQGSGICWAYWMRYSDRGLPDPVTISTRTRISDDDADLIAVQTFCKITSR